MGAMDLALQITALVGTLTIGLISFFGSPFRTGERRSLSRSGGAMVLLVLVVLVCNGILVRSASVRRDQMRTLAHAELLSAAHHLLSPLERLRIFAAREAHTEGYVDVGLFRSSAFRSGARSVTFRDPSSATPWSKTTWADCFRSSFERGHRHLEGVLDAYASYLDPSQVRLAQGLLNSPLVRRGREVTVAFGLGTRSRVTVGLFLRSSEHKYEDFLKTAGLLLDSLATKDLPRETPRPKWYFDGCM